MELIKRSADAIAAFILDQADSETAQPRGVLWSVAGANPATILVPVPVEDIVTRLDRPVVAVERQDLLCISTVWGMAGDAVGEIAAFLAGFLKDHMALDDVGLANAWEVEIIVELSCCPDRARHDAAMLQGRGFAKVGLAALGKGEGEILEECGLIGFDGKEVMRLALENRVGEVALGQQCIGG